MQVDVRPADVDERQLASERPVDMVKRLCAAKAEAISATEADDRVVIAADTIVVRDDVVLGKPSDAAEAAVMLRSLAGRSHAVITGFAVLRGGDRVVDAITTEVHFRDLDDAQIERYVSTGEPLDKAGAYGIQGIGALLVRSIEGSYTNVVGLPLVEVLEAVAAMGGPRL